MSNSSIEMLLWQALNEYSLDLLPQFLLDGNQYVRLVATQLVHVKGGVEEYEMAYKMVSEENYLARESGAYVLGQIGTPNVIHRKKSADLLSKVVLSDKSIRVRSAAASALGHLRVSDAITALVAASVDQAAEVRANVAIALKSFPQSQKARKCLKKLMRDESAKVRFWADPHD